MLKNKKSLSVLLVFCTVCLLVGIGFYIYPDAPSDDELLSVLQDAESVYHLGDERLLHTVSGSGELMLRNSQGEIIAYYDEVDGYEEVVPQIFTKNGIEELENSYNVTTPWILKKGGKVYRCSCMVVAEGTTYFHGEYNPNETLFRLVNRTWNSFTYEVTTTPEGVFGPRETIVLPVTVCRENGKLKIDSLLYPNPLCSSYDENCYTQEELETFHFDD